jgi:ATP-dependent RNA helicase RhlE
MGDAFTLMAPEDEGDVRDIERFIGKPIERLQLEGFNYAPYTARPPRAENQGNGGQGRFAHNRGGRQGGHGGGGQGGGRGPSHGRGQGGGGRPFHGGGHSQAQQSQPAQQPQPKRQPSGTARHEGGGSGPAAAAPASQSPVRKFFSRLRGR